MSRTKLLLLVTALQGWGCAAHHSNGSEPPTDGGPTPSGDAGAYPELVTEPDQGMAFLYAFLGTAKKSIDMTMYEQTDPMVTTILTQAVKAGITVRVILDQNLEMMDNTTAYTALTAAGAQVHWANPSYAATHQKTITVDDEVSAIMTLNLSPVDYKTSRDFAVLTNNAGDVAAVEAVFDADLTNAAVNPSAAGNLVWSPTNSEGALVGMIKNAKASLLVENEEMSDSDVVDALVGAAGRGVDVKVVMEDSRSYATEFNQLVAGGVKLVTYEHAALYIHAKVILLDYGKSGAQVFLGSENFSDASLTENRELGVILTDPNVMSSVNKTLSSDFAGGTTYTPEADGG